MGGGGRTSPAVDVAARLHGRCNGAQRPARGSHFDRAFVTQVRQNQVTTFLIRQSHLGEDWIPPD